MDALASLLARPEGKQVEHKRDLTSPQSVLRTLVAFANTAGGTLLVGVEPEFDELGGQFRVTMRFAARPAVSADAVDRRIIQLIVGTDGLSTSVIAAGIGPSPRATRTRLARLVERGRLFLIGSGPRDPRRRYLVPPESPS